PIPQENVKPRQLTKPVKPETNQSKSSHRDQGLELPHRAPARKAMHFRCFYKRGRAWSAGSSDTALALEQNQPEFPARKPACNASSAISTDSSHLFPHP
ncbi:hypothetical protein MC885_006468, partial [Smutsia gigantea]